jgi:hypothetical protein
MSGNCTALATKADVAKLKGDLANKPNKFDVEKLSKLAVLPLLGGYATKEAVGSLNQYLVKQTKQAVQYSKESRQIASKANESFRQAARQINHNQARQARQAREAILQDRRRYSEALANANRSSREATAAASKAANQAGSAQATANQAAATANAAKAQASTAAAGLASVMALLPGILIAVASFGLIQGQLRATQARIDAQEAAFNQYNNDYIKLINLISQNRIAIEANNAAIANNNAVVENNKIITAANNSRMLDVESTNRSLVNRLNEANTTINSLIAQLNTANARLNAVDSKVSINANSISKLPPVPEIKDLIELSNLQAENQQLRRNFEAQQSDIKSLRNALNDALTRVPTKEDKYITRKVQESTITNASGIRDLNNQLVGIPSKIGQTVKSEFSNSIQTFKQDAQKQVQETIAKTNFTQFDIKKVAQEIDAKIAKVTTDFNERLHNAIDTIPKYQPTEIKQTVKNEVSNQVQQIQQVNNQQVQQINTKIDNVDAKVSNFPTVSAIAVAVGGLDILRQIKDKPTPTPLCAAPILVPPVAAQTKANGAAIGTLQGVTITQNAFTQKAVKVVSETATKIDKTVNHKDFGVQKIFEFGKKAWEATHADKVLQVVNTTLLVHNAMMLSNNLVQTMGEATSMALQALNIKDHNQQAIDVNGLVRGKLNAMLTSVLGAENYAALTARIAQANRIYQSGINILDATRNMFDATHSIGEVTLRHTGEIGNALRNAGVVAEDSYQEMVEKVNPASKRLMGLEKFRAGIDVAEEAFDSVAQVSGNVLEIQENITQIKTEKQTMITEMDTDKTAKKDARDLTKENSQITADFKKADFEAAPPTDNP